MSTDDIHPLIVIDVRDREHLRYVVEVLRQAHHSWTNDVASQIEEQTKPLRIDEPEPGERVTAYARATPYPDHPETFLRLRLMKPRTYEWVCISTGHVYKWRTLIDPVLVRDGVATR